MSKKSKILWGFLFVVFIPSIVFSVVEGVLQIKFASPLVGSMGARFITYLIHMLWGAAIYKVVRNIQGETIHN